MSTTGSFNPPDNPCPTDVMTATALVALRDAGQLRPECHYFVTGPVIGTTGNTSPTTIELHAVTTSTLSKEAKVHQTFNPEGAFLGSYDPDADTANGGTLNYVLDHWNNALTDEDPGSATPHTVHNQWPYHLSGPNLRDNVVDDVTLTGLPTYVASGGEFRDNELRETVLDLTGVTSPGPAPTSFFRRNVINSGTTSIHVPTAYINNNNLNNATVQHDGTGAGSFSFQLNAMLGGRFAVDATTTAQVTANSNIVSSDYRTEVVGKTSQPFILTGNRLNNVSIGSNEFQVSGSGLVNVNNCEIRAGNVNLSGAGAVTLESATCNATVITSTDGPLTIDRATVPGLTVTKDGPGAVTLQRVQMNAGTVTQNAGSSATLLVQDSTYRGAAINLNAGSAGSVSVQSNNTGSITLNHNGQGGVSVFACDGRPTIITSAASTRALQVNSCTGARYTINQNGTGSTNMDDVNGCMLQDTTLNLNSTLAGTGIQTFSFSGTGQSTVNAADGAGTIPMNQTWLAGLSTLNIQPGGNVSRVRLDGNATLNTGAFSQINSIIDGNITVTATAANNNKLANKSFNDWI